MTSSDIEHLFKNLQLFTGNAALPKLAILLATHAASVVQIPRLSKRNSKNTRTFGNKHMLKQRSVCVYIYIMNYNALYIYSLPTHILPYIYIYICTCIHTYIHTITLHYITLHYSTLHYSTLHTYIITYIQIHKYIYIHIHTIISPYVP